MTLQNSPGGRRARPSTFKEGSRVLQATFDIQLVLQGKSSFQPFSWLFIWKEHGRGSGVQAACQQEQSGREVTTTEPLFIPKKVFAVLQLGS